MKHTAQTVFRCTKTVKKTSSTDIYLYGGSQAKKNKVWILDINELLLQHTSHAIEVDALLIASSEYTSTQCTYTMLIKYWAASEGFDASDYDVHCRCREQLLRK